MTLSDDDDSGDDNDNDNDNDNDYEHDTSGSQLHPGGKTGAHPALVSADGGFATHT